MLYEVITPNISIINVFSLIWALMLTVLIFFCYMTANVITETENKIYQCWGFQGKCYGKINCRNIHVITSYSIHYTKLYDIILSVDLLWILSTTFLGFGFKQVFSALIIIAEIYIGLLMIFFMKRKIFGLTVLLLGLLILILTLILKKSNFSLLSENVFLLICTFIAGTGFLLNAIFKSKNKI